MMISNNVPLVSDRIPLIGKSKIKRGRFAIWKTIDEIPRLPAVNGVWLRRQVKKHYLQILTNGIIFFFSILFARLTAAKLRRFRIKFKNAIETFALPRLDCYLRRAYYHKRVSENTVDSPGP